MNVNNKRIIKNFNKKTYNFKKLFVNHFKSFKINDLEKIHEIVPKKLIPKKVVNVKKTNEAKVLYTLKTISINLFISFFTKSIKDMI